MRKKKRKKGRRISNGVKKITQYLESKNISYDKEYRFKDCRDKLPLPFDFIIFEDNKIKCLIEYNGQQHYQKVRKFGGQKALIIQQKHDLIKQEYCATNNLKLIVISFEDEDKIDLILDFNL